MDRRGLCSSSSEPRRLTASGNQAWRTCLTASVPRQVRTKASCWHTLCVQICCRLGSTEISKYSGVAPVVDAAAPNSLESGLRRIRREPLAFAGTLLPCIAPIVHGRMVTVVHEEFAKLFQLGVGQCVRWSDDDDLRAQGVVGHPTVLLQRHPLIPRQ